MTIASAYMQAIQQAMGVQGEALARAAEQRGAIWNNFLSGLGTDISNTIQGLTQEQQNKRLNDLFNKWSDAYKTPTLGPTPITGGNTGTVPYSLDASLTPTITNNMASNGSATTPTSPPPDISLSQAISSLPSSPPPTSPLFSPAAQAAATPGPGTDAAAAPPLQSIDLAQAMSTLPSGSPSVSIPTASVPVQAYQYLLTVPHLTDDEKLSIRTAEARDNPNIIPKSVFDKARLDRATWQMTNLDPSANAAINAGIQQNAQNAPATAPAATPPAPMMRNVAQTMPAPTAPPAASAAPPPVAPTPAPAAAPTPGAPPATRPIPAGVYRTTPSGSAAGTTPTMPTPGMPMMMPPTPLSAMGALGKSPFPPPSAIIKAVGVQRGIPIINAIQALQTNTEGDPEKVSKMVQDIYKGLQNLSPELRQQYFPLARANAIALAGKLGPFLNQVIPQQFDETTFRYSLGQSAPARGMHEVKYRLPNGQEVTGFVPEDPNTMIISAREPARAPEPGSRGFFMEGWARDRGLDVNNLTEPQQKEANAAFTESVSKAAGTDFSHFLDLYATDIGKTSQHDLTKPEWIAAATEYTSSRSREAGAQAADITKLTPGGIDLAALNFKKTGQLPPLGMGDRSTRQQIINRAAELTPDDITRIEAGGNDLAGNRADYRANSASLAALVKSRDAVSAFENTAKKNIQVFLDQAAKVPDVNSPLLNTPTRWASGQIFGNQDVAGYSAARQVAINEIARVTNNPNLVGQLSNDARREIETFNPANATLGMAIRVMQVLNQDMDNRATSLDQQIKETRTRIGTKPGGGGFRYNPNTKSLEPITP